MEFEDEFELELLEEFELELLEELELELFEEFDELLDDELELELLEEFELEFDELFDDELDELLPATMIDPSLLAVFAPARFMSDAGAAYSLASTAVVASAATPAIRADFNFHCFVMIVTPCPDRLTVRRSNGPRVPLFLGAPRSLQRRSSASARASSSVDSGSPASIAER